MGSIHFESIEPIQFANAQLEPVTHSLVCNGQSVYLRKKLWLVLLELVDSRGQLVDRRNLIERAWRGNIYTGEAGLTHAVCHLRKIFRELGIDAEILTVPKTGYVLDSAKLEPEHRLHYFQAAPVSNTKLS